MEYTLYESKLGMVKVYEKGTGFYLDIDNCYDKEIASEKELQKFLKENNAEFVGVDND